MRQKKHAFTLAMLLGASIPIAANAAEIGHYAPGVMNIRDFAVPEPGYYGALYNYRYATDRLNDANGNKISSISPGPGQGIDVRIDVKMYALAPAFIWVTKQKILGAKYGLFLVPTFSNTSLNGALSRGSGTGGSISAGQFNIGDAMIQPVWLGWTKKHLDIAYSYGFYIPLGKYAINTINVPVVGPVRVEAADNTGYGFWTNQNQGSVYIYPWADRRMAIQNALTWEIHRRKRGFDLTPGQNLTYNWGVSQYLPLKKDQSLLAELGFMGYDSFQVSDDSGTAARNPGLHDSVHAVGIQAGVTNPARMIVLNFRWMHEYSAVDRFQGSSLGLNFAIKF